MPEPRDPLPAAGERLPAAVARAVSDDRGVALGTDEKALLAAASRRRRGAMLLYVPLRLIGSLEFSDVYSIDLRRLPPQRPLEGYRIEPASGADIDYICGALVRDEPPHVIRRLWAEGHHCFVARHESRIVAYDWIAFEAVQEEEYAVELAPEHAFCLNAYTHPAHRGRGVHYCLLRRLLEFAAENGKQKAYTLVSLFNRNSWKSHLRMGWTREFTYCYFRPYFTPGRMPWAFTKPRYPVRLDWSRHSWFSAPDGADASGPTHREREAGRP